jgi:hypothetical protein
MTGTHLIRYIFSHMPVHGSHWNVPPGGESGDDELEGLLHESGRSQILGSVLEEAACSRSRVIEY